MGRHSRVMEQPQVSHRGNQAFELPPFVETYTLSATDEVKSLNGVRQPGKLLVEVGESAYGVDVAEDGTITVQGLKRVMGKRHEKFVPDGGVSVQLQDGVLTELTSDNPDRHKDAFDVATSPNSLTFFPEADLDAQDVRITAPAGYFAEQ